MNVYIPMKGDIVKCLSFYYKSYDYNERAEVLDIYQKENGKYQIKLENPLTERGFSWYSASKWTLFKRKETNMPAYERTKFFGVRLDNKYSGRFITMDTEGMTVLQDTKTQALSDVSSVIQQGERWMILQTVALVEPEEPRPPIKITEYK